ncbi:hypothetical protein IEQ34_006534 [Dendrobium chrysotoxum]|uniref:Uncharacterized protein n=1 Tax=Dendrobium chrysotoxum TaxID=161865 RepID=A0AAV7H815_DENCH|nr:hypothetical protein IEQ34_006534 [Dendrobium chrysotoxum]
MNKIIQDKLWIIQDDVKKIGKRWRMEMNDQDPKNTNNPVELITAYQLPNKNKRKGGENKIGEQIHPTSSENEVPFNYVLCAQSSSSINVCYQHKNDSITPNFLEEVVAEVCNSQVIHVGSYDDGGSGLEVEIVKRKLLLLNAMQRRMPQTSEHPGQVRMRIAQKRNEEEDVKEEFYSLVTVTEVPHKGLKGLGMKDIDEAD